MSIFAEWQGFFVVIGSSAGALIGLQFVVLALIANMPRTAELAEAGGAFTTPTIVSFTAVLLLAIIGCMPWQQRFAPEFLFGLVGLAGFTYSAVITVRLRRQSAYRPEWEDWIFHSVLPLAAYALTAAASAYSPWMPTQSLFGVAAGATLLLLIGIHNAWDTVAYHVFKKSRP